MDRQIDKWKWIYRQIEMDRYIDRQKWIDWHVPMIGQKERVRDLKNLAD